MAGAGPPFQVDPGAIGVLETLWGAGQAAYLVGGGVRDALLGREVSDWDIATDARPDRILGIFPGSTYENRFGTVLARGLEITTFRRDHHYADHRRPDRVVFSDDIYEDLARRDLTINAIAWGRSGPGAGAHLVDPADGQGDLAAGLVRAVGDPRRRYDEDALRLLRTIRIAAHLGFEIEPITWRAMVARAADARFVSEERSSTEIRRMLASPAPSRALRLLRDSGILEAVAPELVQLSWVGGDDGEDDHPAPALAVVDRVVTEAPGNERLAFAALLFELGPGPLREVLDRLRLPSRERDAIAAISASAAILYRPDWPDAAVRRYMAAIPAELLDDLLVLRRARAAGDPATAELEAGLADRIALELKAGSPLGLPSLAIDGRDLRDTLGLPEGPTIGYLLERLLDDVIEEPALNARGTLLTRAAMLLDQRQEKGRGGTGPRSIG